jgi:hypothetical protein
MTCYSGFGNLLDGKHPIFTGDFDGNGRIDVMFYYSADGNWWRGQLDNTNQLQWSLAGNTSGFGDLTRNGIKFFTADSTATAAPT